MNDRQTTVVPSPRLCKAWARPIVYMQNKYFWRGDVCLALLIYSLLLTCYNVFLKSSYFIKFLLYPFYISIHLIDLQRGRKRVELQNLVSKKIVRALPLRGAQGQG